MVWYNPFSWGQQQSVPQASAVMEPPVVGATPAPPMGGRRRKTHRRGHKGSKKSRSGRKSTRS